MPTIEVDDEVFAQLQAEAEPLVDTPNSVLRRQFGLPAAEGTGNSGTLLGDAHKAPATEAGTRQREGHRSDERRVRRKRVARGKLLPEQEYELPILRVLDREGGSAPTATVVDSVGEMLKTQFTDLEYEVMSSGEVRWRNRVQWARNNLVRRGLLAPDSPWGVWTLSDAGRREFAVRRGDPHA